MRTSLQAISLSLLLAALPMADGASAGSPGFVTGDTLVGAIDAPGDVDQATFDGLLGEKFKLTIQVDPGLTLEVAVFDEFGFQVKKFKVKGGKKGKSKKKKAKLKRHGPHTLVVSSPDGTVGGYTLLTGRKLPKLAKFKVHKKKEPIPQLTFTEVKFLAYPGSILDVVVVPKGGVPFVLAPANLDLSVFDPDSVELFTTPNESISGFAAHLTGVQLADLGEYRVRVDGIAESSPEFENIHEGATVRIDVIPKHPLGSQIVEIDPEDSQQS